jgi:hypothetical protein
VKRIHLLSFKFYILNQQNISNIKEIRVVNSFLDFNLINIENNILWNDKTSMYLKSGFYLENFLLFFLLNTRKIIKRIFLMKTILCHISKGESITYLQQLLSKYGSSKEISWHVYKIPQSNPRGLKYTSLQ